MNNSFKIVGKGDFKLIKHADKKEISYYHKGEIVKVLPYTESPRNYTAEKLLSMLYAFINEFEKSDKKEEE